MNYGRLVRWSMIVGLVAGFLASTPWVKARVFPPSGPIAEALSSVEHVRDKQTETSALADVLPDSAVLRRGGKPAGVTPLLASALRSANFSCEMVIDVDRHPRLYVCRNRNAGTTEDGCRKDWLLTFELPAKGSGPAAWTPTKRQAFVRAVC